MTNIKKKVLKYLLLPMFIFSMAFLVGCNNTNNTINTISHNMNTVINTINEIETIQNSTLIIHDFMDESNITQINTEQISDNQITEFMSGYINKLSLLNNSIYSVVQTNDSVNNSKMQIIAKAHQVKSLSDQCKLEKEKLDKNVLNTLEELNNTLMLNNNRVNLTKNEIKNNIYLINEIKLQYSTKSEQLSSRYKKLEGSLNTRLAYYNNILSCLSNMEYIILGNCDCCLDTNCQDDVVETQMHQNVDKKSDFKNIDTYENAGKRFKNNNLIPNENNINPYYAYQYPIMGNGFGYNNGFGYGMPYGYGFGMPYGFGGMTYPNINTFRGFKNIDTYKNIPPYAVKENQEDNPTEENKQDVSANSNENEIKATTSPTKKPTPPIIPRKEKIKGFFDNDDILEKNNTVTADDGEDTFV